MNKKIILILCMTLGMIFLSDYSEAALKHKINNHSSSERPSEGTAVLPKKGDIAVIVVGDETHKSRVEANIVNILVNRGYRVVDEKKMRSIRAAAARAQAARYALYGEFDKILKINASYSVAATIIANIIPEDTRENRFKLFTATASAAVLAVRSNGVKLGGKTSDSKQVGYTEAEAMRKAVDEAVNNGMLQLF